MSTYSLHRYMRVFFLIACIATSGACGDTSDSDPPVASMCADPPRGPLVARFSDVTHASGIAFEYASADFKGGGLAVADLDGDGLPDVVASRREGGLEVFRNLGSFKFELDADTELDSRLAIRAIAAGDLDNDGDVDLVLAGTDVAYVMLNNSDGTFAEATRFANSGSTEAVLLVDVDNDGRLDIYFSNYDLGAPSLSSSVLYMQRDGFAFDAMLVGTAATWATTAFDVDGDGRPDLYRANDTLLGDFGRPVQGEETTSTLAPDQLMRNDGAPNFSDIASAMGLTAPRSSMGGLLADFNEDGRLDLYIPNLGAKKLFIRASDGSNFVESAAAFGVEGIARVSDECPSGTNQSACLMLSWSAVLSDFDLDGYDELLVVNGINYEGQSPPPPLMFKRGAERTYHEVATDMGCFDARGMIATDLDGDGDQDVLVSQNNGPLVVYETRDRPTESSWLDVKLRGHASNRDGIGAVVTAHMASGRSVMRVIGSGGVINSSSPAEAFFGLGDDVVEELVVQWPAGGRRDVPRPGHGVIVLDE